MNCIVPFESKVKFDGPVKEISSISLEHEVTKNEKEILGNFIISGTYKGHELSVNTLDFNFVIPFSLNLVSRIDEDSFEFMIDNFTYDISGDEMNVRIDYMVSAEDIPEEIEERTDDTLLEDLLEELETPTPEEKEEEEVSEPMEKAREEEVDECREEYIDATKAVMGIETEADYVKYHVHLVKSGETIETICQAYGISQEMIINISGNAELMPDDKLLIKVNNE